MPRRSPESTKPYKTRTSTKREFNPQIHCGAQLRNYLPGTLCLHPKGFKTPHVGEGKCYLHGGLTPIKHGLNSLIQHGRLKDLVKKIAELDHATMDLEPEALLMRAMVIDYVNRYDSFVDQLQTWYDAIDAKQRINSLPPIPRKFPDLEDASKLIEAVSRIVERMHKIQKEGSIDLNTFRGLMSQMGVAVATEVNNPAILEKIENRWSSIMVDPRSFTKDDFKEMRGE